MPPDTVITSTAATTTPSPGYAPVAREKWPSFFDAFTKVLEGRQVEIEIVGLGLGDQIEAEWLPLNGLTYDPKADTFYVYLEGAEQDLGHAIAHPREILVRTGPGGIEEVVAVDADENKHIVHLRQPLLLAQPAS